MKTLTRWTNWFFTWCRWIHRYDPWVYDDDHNTSVVTISILKQYNPVPSLFVRQKNKKSVYVQQAYSMKYENSIRRCWRVVATDERKVDNAEWKSFRLSYSRSILFLFLKSLSVGQYMRLTSQCLWYSLSQVLFGADVLNPRK